MQSAARKYIENQSQPESQPQSCPQFQWDNYNFPPLLKLFHFSASELKAPQKKVVNLMLIQWLLIIVISILNLITNIVLSTYHYPATRVIYSILNIVIFVFIQLALFHRGYMGMCYASDKLRLYKVGQGVMAVVYFIFMIISTGPFNGFIMAAQLDRESNITMCVFSIIESLMYMLCVLASVLTIYWVTVEDKLETSRL